MAGEGDAQAKAQEEIRAKAEETMKEALEKTAMAQADTLTNTEKHIIDAKTAEHARLAEIALARSKAAKEALDNCFRLDAGADAARNAENARIINKISDELTVVDGVVKDKNPVPTLQDALRSFMGPMGSVPKRIHTVAHTDDHAVGVDNILSKWPLRIKKKTIALFNEVERLEKLKSDVKRIVFVVDDAVHTEYLQEKESGKKVSLSNQGKRDAEVQRRLRDKQDYRRITDEVTALERNNKIREIELKFMSHQQANARSLVSLAKEV